MPSEKPRTYAGRFLREFVLPHRGVAALLALNVLLRTGIGLWWPLANKAMVDRVLVAVEPELTFALFLGGVGYAVIAFNQALLYAFNRLLFRLLVFVTQQARSRVARHLLRLSRDFYDGAQVGRVLTTAVGDPGQITHTFTAGMVNAGANALIVFGGYVILWRMNHELTLAISAVFPVMILNLVLLRPRIAEASERIRESWGVLCAIVSEKASAARVVRSFVAEQVEHERFRERARLHGELNKEQAGYNAAFQFVNGIAIHLGYCLVFLVGGWLYLKGRTTLGTVVAFYGYFNSLFPAVLQLCNLPQILATATGSLGKVFRLLDTPVAIVSRPGARDLAEPVREIVFDRVSFRYEPHLPWAVRDVSAVVKGGSRLGLLGPSGGGKSTLMALLLRFYDPVEGTLRLNGLDLREWDVRGLRRAFALVPQEPVLFSGTVRENVAYRFPDSGDEAVWRALDRADAAGFVRELDGGLEARIGERGVSLSGGQQQRLSIARALLTDPQVLVLDNCTSALDAETERRINATLERATAGRTAIVVSHRVGTVMDASEILVVDEGRLIERGTAAELLGRNGYFAMIHRHQSESPRG